MFLDLVDWETKKNKHSLILFGGVLVGMSLPLFNMVNLITVADPLDTAFILTLIPISLCRLPLTSSNLVPIFHYQQKLQNTSIS